MNSLKSRLLSVVISLCAVPSCWGEEVLVAVANNFHRPAQAMVESFNKLTGHQMQISTGSSGQLFSQVSHGAPYDVFLSADQKRPTRLVKEQLATEQFTYAKGRVVLWSPNEQLFKQGDKALKAGQFKHIALANPKLAPYGIASVEVMNNLGLYQQLESKLVMGKGLNATYQYLVTGNAELGFVAMSQVMQNGKLMKGAYWQIPDNLYQPINQDAVLLNHGSSNPAAKAFIAYLQSTEAKAIIHQFGYY